MNGMVDALPFTLVQKENQAYKLWRIQTSARFFCWDYAIATSRL
jgi:hypothetical protein